MMSAFAKDYSDLLGKNIAEELEKYDTAAEILGFLCLSAKSTHHQFTIGIESLFQSLHIAGYTAEVERQHQIFVTVGRGMFAYI